MTIYIYIHPSSEVVGLFWILENLGRALFPHLETTTIAISRPQLSISLLVQKSPGQFLHPEPLGKRPGPKDLWKKWKCEFSSSGRPKSAPGVRFSESPLKTIGGAEIFVQIRALGTCFVAVERF